MIYQAKEFTLKNGLKVVVKTPEKSDARGLLQNIIDISATTDFITSLPEDYQVYLDDISKEETFIENNRNSGEAYLFAVYLDGVIIGNSILNFYHQVKTKHRGSIGIAINKDYRGMGIGSLLFDIMIEIAKNRPGVTQLELSVMKDNAIAKSLYSSKGFVKTGEHPHELRLIDGTYLDGETMVLFL